MIVFNQDVYGVSASRGPLEVLKRDRHLLLVLGLQRHFKLWSIGEQLVRSYGAALWNLGSLQNITLHCSGGRASVWGMARRPRLEFEGGESTMSPHVLSESEWGTVRKAEPSQRPVSQLKALTSSTPCELLRLYRR